MLNKKKWADVWEYGWRQRVQHSALSLHRLKQDRFVFQATAPRSSNIFQTPALFITSCCQTPFSSLCFSSLHFKSLSSICCFSVPRLLSTSAFSTSALSRVGNQSSCRLFPDLFRCFGGVVTVNQRLGFKWAGLAGLINQQEASGQWTGQNASPRLLQEADPHRAAPHRAVLGSCYAGGLDVRCWCEDDGLKFQNARRNGTVSSF